MKLCGRKAYVQFLCIAQFGQYRKRYNNKKPRYSLRGKREAWEDGGSEIETG